MTTFARLLSESCQRDHARPTLALVYDRFTEGYKFLAVPHKPSLYWLKIWRNRDPRHSAPDFAFFHRIRRVKPSAFGHVGCVQLSSRTSAESRQPILEKLL
jgi:hypothetical protein